MRRGAAALGAIAGVVGLVAAALSFSAFFGSLWWVLDLAANFRPQQLAVLLPLGLIALAGSRRMASAILLVAALNLAVVAPFVLGSGHGIGEGAERMEVVVFNVGISNPMRAEVASWIAEEEPDVVFIFESSFEWEDTIRSADLPLQIVTIVPRGRIAGVTVLANPALRPGKVEVSVRGEAAALSVDLGAERIEVLGIHPPSPTSELRSLRRDQMLLEAATWVQSRSGEVVVVGDFNATQWSHAFRSLRRRGGLVDTMRGSGLQPSWPEGWGLLSIPIDHVLHTPGLGSEDRRTGPANGSEHRPVLVSVGFAG